MSVRAALVAHHKCRKRSCQMLAGNCSSRSPWTFFFASPWWPMSFTTNDQTLNNGEQKHTITRVPGDSVPSSYSVFRELQIRQDTDTTGEASLYTTPLVPARIRWGSTQCSSPDRSRQVLREIEDRLYCCRFWWLALIPCTFVRSLIISYMANVPAGPSHQY
jgi:hypothetical protein